MYLCLCWDLLPCNYENNVSCNCYFCTLHTRSQFSQPWPLQISEAPSLPTQTSAHLRTCMQSQGQEDAVNMCLLMSPNDPSHHRLLCLCFGGGLCVWVVCVWLSSFCVSTTHTHFLFCGGTLGWFVAWEVEDGMPKWPAVAFMPLLAACGWLACLFLPPLFGLPGHLPAPLLPRQIR